MAQLVQQCIQKRLAVLPSGPTQPAIIPLSTLKMEPWMARASSEAR